MKKLDNFIKRERRIEQMREYAEPEELDYLECQLELKQDLLKSYNNVERIIGIYEDLFILKMIFLIYIKLLRSLFFITSINYHYDKPSYTFFVS